MAHMVVSFFELVAAERLIGGFKPAIKHILQSVGQRNPALRFVSVCSEEIFYGLLFVLERHYLSLYDGSFSENFYGLKRVRVGASLKPEQFSLRQVDRNRALFFLIVVPWLKSRVETFFQYHQTFPPQIQNPKFYRWFPFVHAVDEGVVFLFQLRYLFSFSQYFSPALLIIGQKFERLTMNDMMRHTEIAKKKAEPDLQRLWNRSLSRSFLGKIGYLLSRLGSITGVYAKWIVLISLFAFKFLEWWNSPANALQSGPKLPVPPPPPIPLDQPGIRVPDNFTCPICVKPRTNAAAIPSGYVFCYPCIFNYLTLHSQCPISHQPCLPSEIRKLYD